MVYQELSEWPEYMDLPVSSICSWVKTIYIDMSLCITSDGSFAFVEDSDIITSSNNNLPPVFSNAHRLIIHFSACRDDIKIDEDQQKASTNIREFVKFLRQIAPNAGDVKVEALYRVDPWAGMHPSILFELLLRELMVHVVTTRFESLLGDYPSILKLKSAEDIGGLTHINIKYQECQDFELVRRCSCTLQVLKLSACIDIKHLYLLIRDPNTWSNTVYPNMRYLEIDFTLKYSYVGGPVYPSFPGVAAPFSRLQALVCPEVYPFGDDILFRGNQRSLKYLSINLSFETAKTLQDNHVFSSDSHRNLELVKLRVDLYKFTLPMEDPGKEFLLLMHSRRSEYLDKDNPEFQAYHQLVYDIAGHSRVYTLEGYRGWDLQPKTLITRADSLQSLYCLNLSDCALDLGNVIEIVQSMPQLRELGCEAFYATTDMEPSEYLQHVMDTYYPLSLKLKKMYVKMLVCKELEDIIRGIMMLTILCPNLWIVDLEHRKLDISSFDKEWLKQANRPGYLQYKERFLNLKVFI